MNKSKDNSTPTAARTDAQAQAKKESRTRYYAGLASKASKTITIAIICISLSFAGGVLSNPESVEAHYAQEKAINITFDSCITLFMSFYDSYPSYHYEDINETISIDYIVPNPEEEAWQYCSYFFYGE
jgi:hypothetical protein